MDAPRHDRRIDVAPRAHPAIASITALAPQPVRSDLIGDQLRIGVLAVRPSRLLHHRHCLRHHGQWTNHRRRTLREHHHGPAIHPAGHPHPSPLMIATVDTIRALLAWDWRALQFLDASLAAPPTPTCA
jgi:hypothetical protein